MALPKPLKPIVTVGATAFTILGFLQALGIVPFPLYPQGGKLLADYYLLVEMCLLFASAFYLGHLFTVWHNKPRTVKTDDTQPASSIQVRSGVPFISRNGEPYTVTVVGSGLDVFR